MSFLPKISIGTSNKKSTFNLSQDTHTTAEIGYIQPTFCRVVVPGSHMEISSRNLVRLSPLAVPTMGRLSLRNYYYFVDMATLWTPFDAMRKGVSYTYGDGTVSIPNKVPNFYLEDVFYSLFEYGNGLSEHQNLRELKESIYACIYDKSTGELLDDSASGFSISDYFGELVDNFKYQQLPLIIKLKKNIYVKTSSGTFSKSSSDTARLGDLSKYVDITNQNCDFTAGVRANSHELAVLGKFIGASKRLRKHFIGTGYSFNPGDEIPVTPFKLFAVYKAWFDTFAVQRTINFNATNCYKCIKTLSETVPLTDECRMAYEWFDTSTGQNTLWTTFINFLADLSNICYNLPADYFSASDVSAQRGAWSNDSSNTSIESLTYGAGSTTSQVGASASYQQTPTTTGSTAQGMQMAERLLKFINKRSVVGRKIADLLKLDGEVDLHNNEHETVHHLGDDKVDVNISDVMSLASTNDASLGDYAGRGLGMGNTDSFSYDTQAYGILLCLSAIVPQSGYFQGIMKENEDMNRFDFFTDEFDALGYQPLGMEELVSDAQFNNGNSNGQYNVVDDGVFGLVPRYQHLKVGRNVCNGDISIPSMQSVMLPYTLDRHFITCAPDTTNKWSFKTTTLPANTPETFRQIRATEGYGDYNRIFQYVNGDYDHFILQMVFDTKVSAPMKGISESYDTFDKEVDDSTIQAEHE